MYDENNSLYGIIYNSNKYYYIRDILGNILGIMDATGNVVVEYQYDAWGRILSTSGSLALTLGVDNPFKYKGYYYDFETGLYYCNSRYYNPNWGRWLSADSVDYLDPVNINGLNLFAYCNNNPIMYCDPTGHWLDTALDLFFIGLDIYNLCTNDGYKDWENWLALGVDVLFTAIPFVTGGGGQVVKLANVADDISDFKKITVIGESMNRVQTVSQFVNATDNLYDGFKAYDKLSDAGTMGKIFAEIGGKASNVHWLYTKLKHGYKVIDIGVDSIRTIRSSSYIFEKVFLGIWRTRNIWKWSYHIDF